MFEKLSTVALQEYWWFLVALLGGLFLFLTFVQGGQTKLGLAKDEAQKDLIVNALGRKWELTFTTLVLFGGAIFAAFPLLYAVSFGGAYALWMAILFSFIIQAVAYEYRKKPNNFLGQKSYEAFLFINGTLGIFLIGVALGTFFSGAAFKLDAFRHMTWLSSTRGLEELAVPFNLAFGAMLLFLARLNGDLFLLYQIEEAELQKRLRRSLLIDCALFLIFFLATMALLLTMDGFSVVGERVVKEPQKFLHNFLAQPWLLGFFLMGVVLFLAGVFMGYRHKRFAFWVAGAGIVAVGLSLLLLVGFNETPILPSVVDPGSSLTIHNASGSRTTLIAMSYVSLMIPFVLGYIAYVWRAMSRPLSEEEIKNDSMSY